MRSANSKRSIGRGRGAPSTSAFYADPRSNTGGSRVGSNSRVGSAYSWPAIPSGRGRGVSNQPAWLKAHQSNISPGSSQLPISSGSGSKSSYKAKEQGSNSVSCIYDDSKQTHQEQFGTPKHPQQVRESNNRSLVRTTARNDVEKNSSLVLAVTNSTNDTDNRHTQAERESEEEVEDLEKVADQFLRNFDEDGESDSTEEQLKRAREDRKRRIHQQYAQQNLEENVFVEENDTSFSKAKRNRALNDAAIEPSRTDEIMANNNYSPLPDVRKEFRYGIYADQEEQIDKIPNGKKSDDDDDDAFDMFADDDKHNIDKLQAKIMQIRQGPQQHSANTDAANYDDDEGYYRPTIGEYMGPLGQYRVLGNTGKGVFSTVIKCIDISVEDDEENTKADGNNQQQQHKVVAIKLIRNNETMAKAAVKELRILRMLKPTGGNTFCVELLDKFEHLNHTTFVFEYLDLNLRETLHKFGRNVGIAISAVRTYSKQLLHALQHLTKHGVVHADIKPDNILVSANYGMVKLCDFGSAFLESEYMEADPTPYLVSRFYRPPEVILGLMYDRSIDLWSLAVTLAELFTGNVLFPGNTNNDMLRRFMDCLGPFSNKMLRRHFLAYQKLKLQPHFDPVDYRFRHQTFDKVTGKPVIQHVHASKLRSSSSTTQLVQVLLQAKSSSDDRGTVLKFSDFLGRCLALDPHKRISVHDALSLEFISATTKKAAA